MKHVTVSLMALALVILLSGGLATADKITIVNVTPSSPPRWTPIPGVQGVEHAPNIGQDVFRYRGGFYCHQGGAWYNAQATTGPWVAVPAPPQVFYNIQAPYFKVPPGWAKGKKTGWGGAPMPPGQMKKQGGQHIPPGQAKKMHGHPGD